MKLAALGLLVFTIGASHANLLLDSEWESFKLAHSKQFGSRQEVNTMTVDTTVVRTSVFIKQKN